MNDGMYIGLRAELQEANGLYKEMLTELRRMNELLAQALQPPVQVMRTASGDTNSKPSAKKGK